MTDIFHRTHFDPMGGVTFERIQDAEPYLERNKVLRDTAQTADWGKHVASVPVVLLERWLQEEAERGHRVQFGSKEFNEIVWRKLRDPDFAYLRTDVPLPAYRK